MIKVLCLFGRLLKILDLKPFLITQRLSLGQGQYSQCSSPELEASSGVSKEETEDLSVPWEPRVSFEQSSPVH